MAPSVCFYFGIRFVVLFFQLLRLPQPARAMPVIASVELPLRPPMAVRSPPGGVLPVPAINAACILSSNRTYWLRALILDGGL